MIPVLSLVTSVKDYLEVVHKLIEYDSSNLNINYSELGAIITYFVITLKNGLIDFFSFSFLSQKNLWSLPIIIPDISSAMVSEISVLDGYFHNAFNFLDTPVSYSHEQNSIISSLEKFTIGALNSIFLCLPTSTAHIITLRRFVMQGLEAGYISGLGTIAGNLLFLASVILGWRFLVIPWLSLDILRYVLGFVLLVKYMWDSYNERRVHSPGGGGEARSTGRAFQASAIEESGNIIFGLSKKTRKIFLLNFLLALTEQTSIYPFISNLSFSPEASILESFPADSYTQFVFLHFAYLLGIAVGCLSLLHLTCWFWENPAFKIYMWMISSFKVSTSFYYKVLNFTFLYLTMISAISSIPYYGLDYTITNPLGYVNDDRILQDKVVLETSFLGSKASDRNTRRNPGRHGRRERWKRRIRKYRTFDASLYDQGIYDLFTIEDLNYGFDRFWLRRKLRNHHVKFRFFPGPWMRSFKKQLAKPRLESYTGPRVEFFRILFEQVYHPSFHAYESKTALLPHLFSRSSVGGTASKSLKSTAAKPISSSLKNEVGKNLGGHVSSKQGLDVSGAFSWNAKKNFSIYSFLNDHSFKNVNKNTSLSSNPFLPASIQHPTGHLASNGSWGTEQNFSPSDSFAVTPGNEANKLQRNLRNLATPYRNKYLLRKNLIHENSTLRKFVRKLDNRLKTSQIALSLKNRADAITLPEHFSSNQRLDWSGKARPSGLWKQDKKIYSKRWKQIFSKMSNKNSYANSVLPAKDTNIKKQRKFITNEQILRYRSLIQNKDIININNVNVKNPQKFTDNSPYVSPKPGLGWSGFARPSDPQHVFLHPLKFYLQQEAAFNRKLRYYTPSVYRKFSIENNAPYFRVMMRRYFYNFKPTNRWERTMKVASLRKARRKTTRIPRKLQFEKTTQQYAMQAHTVSNPINSKSKQGPISSNQGLYVSPNQGHISSNQGLNVSGPWLGWSGKARPSDLWDVWSGVSSSHPALLLSNPERGLTTRLQKPTYNYSVVSKRASRYRYQIYKDVLQHWYYSPFNRFLLKMDVDSFIKRQPNTHFLTSKEENLLHLRRFLLSEHYNTLRWYTNMEHYRSMKTRLGSSTKSFSSRAYNQQFAGTFKKIRHLFAITPSQGNVVLKFDQPLYNEYQNTSSNPLLNPLILHEELMQDISSHDKAPRPNKVWAGRALPGQSNQGLDVSGPWRENRPWVENLDLLSQSQKVVRDYLIKARPVREDYIKNLLNQNNYKTLTQFIYKGQKTRGDEPITNQRLLNNQEKQYLLTKNEKLQIDQQFNSSKLRTFINDNNLMEDLYITYLKKWKRHVNDQEALKNYLTRRIDKREKRKQKKEKHLLNKLKLLENSFTNPATSNQQSWATGELGAVIQNNPVALESSATFLTTGLQKSILEGMLTFQNTEKSLNIPLIHFSPKQGLDVSGPRNANKANLSLKSYKRFNTLNNSKKQNLSKEIRVTTAQLTQIFKKYKKTEVFTHKLLRKKIQTFISKRFTTLYKKFKTTFSSFLGLNKISNLLKPIKRHVSSKQGLDVSGPWKGFHIKNWRKKERALGKQKRLRKEFKLLNKQSVLATSNKNLLDRLNINSFVNSSKKYSLSTNIESRKKNDFTTSFTQVKTKKTPFNIFLNESFPSNFVGNDHTQNASSLTAQSLIGNDAANLKSSEVPQKQGMFHLLRKNAERLFLGVPHNLIQNFKRKRAAQRHSRSRRNRGVFKKRTFSNLLKKDLKTLDNSLSYDNKVLLYHKIYATSDLSDEMRNFTAQKKEALDFELKGLKQRKAKQRKQRYWKQKRSKFSQKRQKYRKRRRYSVGKIRILSKQFKRVKNKLEIQNWWWKQFIPSIQASTDALWQIEKDKLIQQKLSELSSTEILERDLRDTGNTQNTANYRINNSQNFLQIGNKDFKPLAIPEAIRLHKLSVSSTVGDTLHISSNQGLDVSGLRLESQSTKSTTPLDNNSVGQGSSLNIAQSQEGTHEKAVVIGLLKFNKMNQLYENLFIKKPDKETSAPSIGTAKLSSSSNQPPALLAGWGAGRLDNNSVSNQLLELRGNSTSLEKKSKLFFSTALVPNTVLPFYAGWDEALRKFVITNRMLSRQDAGNRIKNLQNNNLLAVPALKCLFPALNGGCNKKEDFEKQPQAARSGKARPAQTLFGRDMRFSTSLELRSNSTSLVFTQAPLEGMNAATTLYWQIPFTTYDPDQFFALGMDGFSPIGWRKFLFRHSILKSWLGSKTKQSKHKTKNYINSKNKTSIALELRSNSTALVSTFINQVGAFNKNKSLFKKVDYLQKLSTSNSKNTSRRLKKRYRRVKKHPRTPVWFPSGPLLNQVLPVHYIYVFYKRARLPRDRYLKRRLLNTKTIQNSESFHLLSGASRLSLAAPSEGGTLEGLSAKSSKNDFTLRKRLKPKRKFHLKRNFYSSNNKGVIPRRLKFIGSSSDLKSPSDFSRRMRPLSSTQINKLKDDLTKSNRLIADLVKEQKNMRNKQRNLSSKIQTPALRVKQLKRRVQRQIIRTVWRYRPRAGGFVWPGDYLKLELVKAPKLKSHSRTSSISTQPSSLVGPSSEARLLRKANAVEKRSFSKRKKRTLVEWQIQPKKYLYEKHNLLSTKRKLEKSQNADKIRRKIKEKTINKNNNI